MSFVSVVRSFHLIARWNRVAGRSIWRSKLSDKTNFERHKTSAWCIQTRDKSDGNGKELSSLVQPVPVTPCNDPDGINVGQELTGSLKKENLLKLLNQFYRRKEVKLIAAENGLDNQLFHQAYVSFRRYCVESEALPVDLHIVLSDILQEAGHLDDIFPYFLRHAKAMFPHLDCMEDLCQISDLRQPANWYPDARRIQRKIVYHAGPTNSGKTYHALERFLKAKSGVYCGPLRMLANEVHEKANNAGTPCDLITGEERRYADPSGEPSSHVACTVEMTSTTTPYEVAVIDEIQLLRDTQRGWAWTRALLGVCAEELHICGEGSAIEMVQELALDTGDEFEVRKYKRLTPLKVLPKALDSLQNVNPGDCIVCFSKNDIYYASRQLEKRGIEVAVIYGGLPPGTKLAQSAKFNDPNNSCKVMVATDAIGMGLNLNIKRIVFFSLMKPTVNQKGEKEIDVIPPTQALQIAGRAGRFGTTYETGEVTTYKSNDLGLLKKLMKTDVEDVEQAGLHPTAEQIELFAYHLPKASLSNLIDIFVTLCQVDSGRYFLCNVDDFKFLADMIEHVPLALRVRYVFCCAPIPKRQPFVCTMFLKFARQFSRGEALTLEWVSRQIGWPLPQPKLITDLVHLEGVFDVLDLYLWLSYRFPDLFPDTDHIRDMQKELDAMIQMGVFNITRLLKNTETSRSNATTDDDEDNVMRTRSQRARKPSFAEEELEDEEHAEAMNNTFKASLRSRFAKAKNRTTPSPSGSGKVEPVSLDANRQLSEQLLEKGVITRNMLAQLKKELTDSSNKGHKPRKK